MILSCFVHSLKLCIFVHKKINLILPVGWWQYEFHRFRPPRPGTEAWDWARDWAWDRRSCRQTKRRLTALTVTWTPLIIVINGFHGVYNGSVILRSLNDGFLGAFFSLFRFKESVMQHTLILSKLSVHPTDVIHKLSIQKFKWFD